MVLAINTLIIENFQSHALTEIDLSPGLTVMVGESDTGKSAALRALRWLLLNEPRGRDFIRAGTTECRVTAVLNDGTRITRERTSSRNRYLVTKPDGARDVYEGFGSEIPKEVTDLHGVTPVHLDEDLTVSLNVAGQLEGPFLLNQSGSLKSRAIGRLHAVHIIDAAARDTAQDIARLQREARRLDEQVGYLDGELANFSDLPQLRQQLDDTTAILQSVELLQLRQAGLTQLLSMLQTTRQQISRRRQELARLNYLQQAAQLLAEGTIMAHRRLNLFLYNTRLKRLQTELGSVVQVTRATAKTLPARDRLNQGLELNKLLRLQAAHLQELLRIRKEKVRQTALREQTRHIPEKRERLIQLEQTERLYAELRLMTASLAKVTRGKKSQQLILNNCRRLPLAMAKLNKLNELTTSRNGLRNFAHTHRDASSRIAEGTKFLTRTRQDVLTKAKEYGLLLSSLSRCPTCFGPVNEQIIRQIVQQLTEGVETSD